MDPRSHNRAAWDKKVEQQNRWTTPVSSDAIQQARQGQFRIWLTPTQPAPTAWFPLLQGMRTLCLASGGGQQGPLLAAAGAVVTVFDNSPRQLAQDRFVAERDGLTIETVEGDMADLSMFSDEAFELIVHPCSNCFVPAVRPVWRESYRVLHHGGVLLAGFANPIRYLFDDERMQGGSLDVCNRIPYSDLRDQADADLRRLFLDPVRPVEFAHTLSDQIGGQLDAGFLLAGMYEDRYAESEDDLLSRYIDSFMATRAVKPDRP